MISWIASHLWHLVGAGLALFVTSAIITIRGMRGAQRLGPCDESCGCTEWPHMDAPTTQAKSIRDRQELAHRREEREHREAEALRHE